MLHFGEFWQIEPFGTRAEVRDGAGVPGRGARQGHKGTDDTKSQKRVVTGCGIRRSLAIGMQRPMTGSSGQWGQVGE